MKALYVWKNFFSDLDVLEEKKGEKIAYFHQLHTVYKSGSKLVKIFRLFLKIYGFSFAWLQKTIITILLLILFSNPD